MKKSILLLSCIVGLQAFAATDIVPGTPYYMRNVSNGKFFTAGGWWGTHAIVGETGLPVTFESVDSDQYRALTPCGYPQAQDIYIDKSLDESCVWTAVPVNGNKYVFKYMLDGNEMAVGMDGDMYINQCNLDADNAAQQWELLTREELVEEIMKASTDNPVNATFLMPGASIVRNGNSVNEHWIRTDAGENARFEFAPATPDADAWHFTLVYRSYNEAVENGESTAYTITNVAENVPNGIYAVSADIASDGAKPEFTVNGIAHDYTQAGDAGTLSAYDFGSGMFEGKYKVTFPLTVTDGKIEIKFTKAAGTGASVLYFDNFEFIYGGADGNIYDVLYANVKEAMDNAQAIATRLNLSAYDNSEVQTRWDEHTITGDGTEEIHMTYEALAAASKAQTEVPGDMTYAILNPSFELGSWGWAFNTSGNTGVAENAEGKATEGGDGKYLYNTWDDGKGNVVSQVLSGMPAGTYVATASVSASANSTIYIFANDDHNGITVPEDSNEGVFRTVELEFELPASGDIKLGIVGGDENGDFVEDQGAWFRADNFTLTRKKASTTAAVIDIDSDDSIPAEYFNLQGMKIANPAAGQIYIMKKGSTVKKIIK